MKIIEIETMAKSILKHKENFLFNKFLAVKLQPFVGPQVKLKIKFSKLKIKFSDWAVKL